MLNVNFIRQINSKVPIINNYTQKKNLLLEFQSLCINKNYYLFGFVCYQIFIY